MYSIPLAVLKICACSTESGDGSKSIELRRKCRNFDSRLSSWALHTVSNLVVQLGWVDRNPSVPLSCLVAQLLLPNFH